MMYAILARIGLIAGMLSGSVRFGRGCDMVAYRLEFCREFLDTFALGVPFRWRSVRCRSTYREESGNLIAGSLREGFSQLGRVERPDPGRAKIEVGSTQHNVRTDNRSIGLCSVLPVKTTNPGFVRFASDDKG